MPTYTYQCDDCHEAFEQFQKFSDEPLTECPSCHGAIHRVIHPVGIVFKGTGWYINDSRGGKTDTTSPAPAKPPADTATATPAASSEATPAAPAATAPASETKAAV